MKRNIISIYKIFALKLYNQGLVNLKGKSLDFFLETFKDQMNKEFVWNYISFQMCYWYEKKTIHSLHPSWVFGNKAIERWNKKSDNWSYYVQLFLNKVEIERQVDYYSHNMVQNFEDIRAKNFGTELGLADCLSFAFYSEKSKYCKVCDFKDYCKQV